MRYQKNWVSTNLSRLKSDLIVKNWTKNIRVLMITFLSLKFDSMIKNWLRYKKYSNFYENLSYDWVVKSGYNTKKLRFAWQLICY